MPQDALQKTAATQPYPVGADRVLPDCEEWRKQSTPKGFEIGCFFQPAVVQKPNVLAPNYGMRVAPMSYSPQTGYFYAVGAAGLSWLRRADDPYFFSTSFNSRVPGIGEPRLRRPGGDRQPDQQDRLEEGIPPRPAERGDDDGGRAAVSGVGRWQPRSVRREDRQRAVAVSNRRGGRAGRDVRDRRRAVHRDACRRERVGVQARRHAPARGRTGGPAAGSVHRSDPGHDADRDRVARHATPASPGRGTSPTSTRSRRIARG